MRFLKTILFVVVVFFFGIFPAFVFASEIIIEDADTVWSPDLIVASPDVTDSTDASAQTLSEVFVSNADTVRSVNFNVASADVTDSTDAPPQELSEVFVSHADTVWSIGLEKAIWEAPLPPEEPEKWSFAIITDLHIGKNDPDNDYNGPTWDDLSGGSYSSIDNVTTREYLRQIVDIINTKRGLYNIDFVVVTGDIADSAELSEFKEAIEILNNLEVPWIPIIGNHDVWPHYGPELELPNPYKKMAPETSSTDPLYSTDRYFNNLFNSQYENLKLSGTLQNWEQADTPIWNPKTNPEHYSYFQNFAFDYNGYHFITLDFNERDNALWPLKGVAAGGDLHNFSGGTWEWFINHLQQYLAKYPESEENIILLAHHPLRNLPIFGFSGDELDKIQSFLTDYTNNVFAEFAGHTHPKQLKDHWLLSGNLSRIMRVVEIPTNSNSPFALGVQVYPEGKIDYSEILGYELIITAKSPVDLVITDPDNLTISKELNEIPGATYMEMDIDGDGSLDDWVGISERKLGNYQIKTTPEPGATPADTYTLETSTLEDSFGYTPVILAENVPISGIPTVPYIFEVKEKETTQLVYTGDLSGQYSDSINLSAILTDGDGNPLANKKIVFEIGEQSISAITNENGIATISLTLNQIPGKYYFIDTTFSGDEDYLPSFDSNSFEILGSAKWFKKDAIGNLEAISTTNKHAQEDIEKAIKYINQSLNESLWSDASHLEPQHGHKIFNEEKMAVQHLMKITEERGEHTDPAIVEEVRAIIKKLIKADEKLAVVAIFDVKNIPLQDPKFNDKVDLEIIKAEEELNKAYQEVANNRSDKAIDNFKKAWEHAQLAIKFANLEKKP